MSRALRVGIIGALCAGKTTVLRMLGELGAATVSADEVNRELLKPGRPLLQAVIAAFGPEYVRPDGTLDRRKLAELVFSDDQAREKLEAIVHPPMVSEMKRRIEEAEKAGARIVAAEAAVLHRMGAAGLIDVLVRVTADREERLRRLMRRDGLSRQEAEKRLRLHDRLGLGDIAADWTIDTTRGEEHTASQVRRLWRHLQDLAAARGSRDCGGTADG
ncbi:MAG: dephospho-CoA kinase [Armatimonadetes bacterium]|nr:dephospho-CoA kinase [Armatimonadota bacterium]